VGEASRRKDLVESVRKKIGDQAAQALAALEQRVSQLQLQHQAFVFSIEGLRREVSEAKAAPAELRRDVLAFRGDLAMKAEQIEALGMRLAGLQTAVTVDGMKHDELDRALADLAPAAKLLALADAIDSVDEQLYAMRYNAGADAQRLARFESLTFRQRLRWLWSGRLPTAPEIPLREMRARVTFTAEEIAATRSRDAADG
jgi:chromosome segregation ATPase